MKSINSIWTIFLVIGLIILFFGSVSIIYNALNSQKSSGVSCLKLRDVAEEVAKNWRGDATLECASMETNYVEGKGIDGNSEIWVFFYFSSSSTIVEENLTKFEHISITVSVDKSVKVQRYYYEWGRPLRNWTIDSNTAIEIAKCNNHTLSSFLTEYHDTIYVSSFSIKMEDRDSNDNAVWEIHLSSIKYTMINMYAVPIHIHIRVDAFTGKVIELSLPNSLPGPREWYERSEICCVFVPGITLVFVAIVVWLYQIGRRIWTKKEKKAYEELKRRWEMEEKKNRRV